MASDIDGYRTVSRADREALLVPPGDADALRAALRTLLDDPARRAELVAEGRTRADEFSMTHLAERFLPAVRTGHGRAPHARGLSPDRGGPAGRVTRMVAVIVIAVVVVLILLFFWLGYNGLVKRRNQVDNAWSQIDVQLKRRHDLIPNLVETVKGYAAHERGTFEAVTDARANAINAQTPQDQAQAENVLSGALKSLFAVAEAYPDLKANQNFLNLQEELTASEDKVAYARQYYNDSGAELQHADPEVPDGAPGRHVPLREARVLRRRSRRHGDAPGPVLVPR